MPVERAAGGTSLIDVLDRVLDKGIVIDAWVRVSLVGIDLITVEARIVVASIDTYLKYSEAVSQSNPVTRPAVESKAYEDVVAENAALRASVGPPAQRGPCAPRSRAPPGGPAPCSVTRPSATARARRRAAPLRVPGGETNRSRRGCGWSRVRRGRWDVADCAHLALQWLGEVLGISQSICLLRPVGRAGRSFGRCRYGLAGVGRHQLYGAARRVGNPLITALTTRKHVFFPAPHSAADRRRRPAITPV